MTDCKDALKNLFEYLDNELEKEDSDELCKHMELCRKCYDRVEFEKALRDHIKQKAANDKAPEHLVKRIQGLLDKICPEEGSA